MGRSNASRSIRKIEKQRQVLNGKEPENLEEQAISLVGLIYMKKLIKGLHRKAVG